MKQDPTNVWNKESKKNTTSFTRYITIYYTTANVATFTSEQLIDFPTFISATGGNLGLFLGLSFLGVLFSLYEYIEKALLNVGKSNAKRVIHMTNTDNSQCK